MGLLDKIKGIPTNPLAMAGLGLLSMPTRSRTPINPIGYALQGMQAGVQNQQMQTEAEARKQQMEQQKAAYALQVAQYTRKAMAENEALVKQKKQESALAEWAASQPPEIQKFALAAPEAAMKVYAESLKPKDAPTQVQTYMLAHPEDKALKGFDQWVRANKASGATRIQVGAEDKPLLNDAAAWINDAGEQPNPMMTPQQAAGMGFRPQTSAQKAEADQNAKLKAKQDNSGVGVSSAVEGYYASVQKWRENRANPDAYAEAEQQRRRMAQVLAARRNPGRAPTDADVNLALQDIPNPLSVSQGVGAVLGGDPFTARMKVIEQELGYSPDKGMQIVPGASPGVKNSVDSLLEKYK